MNETQSTETVLAVREYIQANFLYHKPDVVLTDELPLFESGIIDSLGLVRLIGFLSERLKIRVEPDEVLLENFETLGTIRAFIQGKLKNRSS